MHPILYASSCSTVHMFFFHDHVPLIDVPYRLFAAPTTSSILITHFPSTFQQPTSRPIIFTHHPPLEHTRTRFSALPTTHVLQFPPAQSAFGTQTHVPAPAHTRHPDDKSRHRRQTPIIIFFEVLCGVVAVALFLGILRFCCSYRKTPAHDRVTGVINRHRLQMELDELQRRPPVRRRFSVQDPAPPYVPRPPSYVEVSASRGPEYTEVPIASPPNSPPLLRASLEVDTPRIDPSVNHPNG